MKPLALWLSILIASFFVSPLSLRADDLVFFGNLHSHSSYSDGSGTPSKAYKYARDKGGLDFLALTDHNHRQAEAGAKERADGKLIGKNHELYTGPKSSATIPTANRYTKINQFVALYGQEFSTISAGNHVNVFDVNEVIDDQVVTNGGFNLLLTWLESHPDSMGQKAIIQFNHAADLDDYRIQYGADDFGSQAQWIARMNQHVALLEILNGPAMAETAGNRARDVMEQDFDHYLLLGFHVAPTGDQDNHYKTWGTSTDVRTGVITDELTKPNLLSALRARHAYATEDKNLRLVFKVNDHLCGDILPQPATGQELRISYTIKDDDEPAAVYKIEVRSGTIGGDTVRTVETVMTTGNTSNSRSIEDVRYDGGAQFIYFKITQANEEGRPDRVWTAPIWFEGAPQSPDNVADFVASKNSSIYHVSPDCRSARAIKNSNRITGAAAMEGRTRHQDCPIQ